jgi:flagellar biosynthesis chaperone FliJ
MDRTSRRIATLLKARRREEQAARRTLESARGWAESLRRRPAGRAAVQQARNGAARAALAAGVAPGASYRGSVADLRAAMAETLAALRDADEQLHRCRLAFRAAAAQKKAAATLLAKHEAARRAERERLEARHLDDVYAARAAGGFVRATD